MTKFGQVVAYDSTTRNATVEYGRPEACEKCGACGGSARKESVVLQADCAVGDWVRIELPEHRFLQAAALAYGVPLAAFLAGLVLGQRLTGSDGGAAIGALLGLAVSIGILRLTERRIQNRRDWSAHITAVYPDKPTQEAIGCGGSL